MKIFIILALIALARFVRVLGCGPNGKNLEQWKATIRAITEGKKSATNFDMEVEEGGETFVEQIQIDTERNTEEFSVPQHSGRAAVGILKDFTKGLKAAKMPSKAACYIAELSPDDEIPVVVQKELNATGSKFPKKIEIKDKVFLPVGKMTEGEAGSKIVVHCIGLKLIKVVVLTKQNMSQVVTGMLRRGEITAPKQGKGAIDPQVSPACATNTVSGPNGCSVSKLASRCRLLRQDQLRVYSLSCTREGTDHGCQGVHVLHSQICCNFFCTE